MMYLDQLQQLKLKTVRLVESNFSTAAQVERQVIEKEQSFIQTRRWVEVIPDHLPGLTAVASLGIRLIKAEDTESDDPYTFYSIEAKFAVEFDLEEEAKGEFLTSFLDKFVDTAPVNIVWPFWRELVYSTLRSASLPTPEIPLMPAVFRADTTDTEEEGASDDDAIEDRA